MAKEILNPHDKFIKQLLSHNMIQKYFFNPEKLNLYFLSILEKLRPYLYSNQIDTIFVYLEETGLEDSTLEEAVKNLPDDMSTRVMTLREQLFYKGREAGIAEERERFVVQTILNAYDKGFDMATIQAFTGENEEKIHYILKQYRRVDA